MTNPAPDITQPCPECGHQFEYYLKPAQRYADELLNSAKLDDMFPAMNSARQDTLFAFARALGWKEDRPVSQFADEYRREAIEKATGETK